MDIEKCVAAAKQVWNAQADENNQWDTLGEDEKIAVAFMAGRGVEIENMLTSQEKDKQ